MLQDGTAAEAGERWLTAAEIRAWPAGAVAPEGHDPSAPLRAQIERHGLAGPLQLAGRNLPIGCVALEITQRCNLDCTLCYLSDHAEAVHDLPLDEVFRRIELIRSHYGPGTHVQVTGGDPTLRRRDELIRVVRRLAERDLRAALFTNGIRASRELLQDLARVGLVDVAFHVDVTQGRRGYGSEIELNEVRACYLERARGLGLRVLFNTTVTESTLDDVPALMRFFIGHADQIHLVSFQLQADTGRGVLRGRGPGLTRERLIQSIAKGAGRRIDFDHPLIGHPDCNRYAGLWVAGDRTAVVFDDPRFFARLFDRSRGWGFAGNGAKRLVRRCLAFAMRNPALWPGAVRYLGRKVRQLGLGLLRSRGRVQKLSVHIHSFMDAAQLERARCESCVFMTMTAAGPVSMCIHNARRDPEILKPLRLPGGDGFWDPLTGKRKTGSARAVAPDLPLKRLKGRRRLQAMAARRAGGQDAAASFSDQS